MTRSHALLTTLGPSSLDGNVIKRLDGLGVDVFRINMSHTEAEDLTRIIPLIREHTDKSICIDTEGAQIRNARAANGCVEYSENSVVSITGENGECTADRLVLTPGYAVGCIRVGSLLSVDFNSVILQVLDRNDRSGDLVARVVSSGTVGSNKAVTVDHDIELPVLSDKDVRAIEIAKSFGTTHFALSFASSREAVLALRDMVADKAFIISKVESRTGVRNLEGILEATDAVLIDRGDLSREVGIEKIPFLQKYIIRKSNEAKVPVYVATNLLESMISERKPTRAEANDVVNTLMDGADGLVLAAETAIGKYPVDSVAMVASLVDEYEHMPEPMCIDTMLNAGSHFLVKPHGGRLVYRVYDDTAADVITNCRRLDVEEHVIMDAEQIALGGFSPLQGFMNRGELENVLEDYALPDGTPWPLPILLQVSEEKARDIREGATLALYLSGTDDAYATMNVHEVYRYDLKKLARDMFGTTDDAHAGVRMLMERGEWFVGGDVMLIKRIHRPHKQYELTPHQTRAIFENRGWSRVVGFHTRNVIHRAHEALQMLSMDKGACDGLLVHPVVGPKKKDDYTASAILGSYEMMMDRHYPKGKVLLAAFSTFSRYAGPREAVFTALCRKNYGCSHFIVGRDHTGVGNYYTADASQILFRDMADIGITPVFFDKVHYCASCDDYVESCKHGGEAVNAISGTEARAMLRSGKVPPAWFMRPDISQLLLDRLATGEDIFV